MQINFCTLFDSNYLDKALALQDSLEKNSETYQLFCYCFDDRAFDVLTRMKLNNVVPILWKNCEDDELRKIRKTRTAVEYNWTCTPRIIEYTLDHYPVENCTYIDADMFFFGNPQELFEEIDNSHAHVVITPHRFDKSKASKKHEKRAGKYCVEFNYFDQTPEAREALSWWKEQCNLWCYYKYEDGKYGDQKYLEEFPKRFKGVHELRHLGGGVAPWNLNQYRFYDSNAEGNITLKKVDDAETFQLILYHFQSIKYFNQNIVNINSGTQSKVTKYKIYIPYLKAIGEKRKILLNYGIDFNNNKSYGTNVFMTLYYRYFLMLRVKSMSDVIDLRKIKAE